MHRPSLPWVLFILGSIIPLHEAGGSGIVRYPEDSSGDRMAAINNVFRYSLVQTASASLDRILDLVNVSTALNQIQKDYESYQDKYTQLATEAIEEQMELSDCIRVFLVDQLSEEVDRKDTEMASQCQKCYQQCPLISSSDATQCLIKFKELDIDVHSSSVQEGINFIDRVHKEVNKISSFVLQLLSQFQPLVKDHVLVKEHLMRKLNLTAGEISEIFESLKFLDVYQVQAVQLSDTEVKQVRMRVDKLLKSMGSDKNSDLIDEEDLIPFVHVPGKPEQSKSVWKQVVEVLESAWDTTKDVSVSVWGKTKDVSSTAFCSVKNVFFSSDCNNSKRKRRSLLSTVSTASCDPEKTLSQIMTECGDHSACSNCASSLETCADRDLSELSDQHQLLQDTLDLTRDEMQQLLRKSAVRREQLMNEAQTVFTENLWIMPMARAFQETKDNFQVEDIWFDPSDYYQSEGKVFYRNVRAKLSDKMGTAFPDLLLTLRPLDVHNETMTAQFTADAFVNKFQELEYVNEAVDTLIKGMNIWEI